MHIKAEKSAYHIFALYYEYDPVKVEFCRALKDTFGWDKFTFNSDQGLKRWVFSDPVIVQEIIKGYPTAIVEPDVAKSVATSFKHYAAMETQQERVAVVQQKTDTNIEIKGIKGELYPYQKVGVEFLIESGGRAIISDPPGLGKSLQALAYIAHEGFSRSLIVAPASVKSSWVKEVKKWTKMSYVEIDSKTDISKIPADVQLWIINYDILKKHLDTLLKTRFDVVVSDECHMVKSRTAMRTKALMSIAKHVPHVVLLSGTPLLSRPVEMFTLLNMVDPKIWNNWYDFTRKFCGGHQGRFGYEVGGATNTEELHTRIKRHFIRRQKKDVLTQLPPKVRVDVPVELDPAIRKQYDIAENDLVEYLYQYKGKQPAEVAKVVAAEQLAKLNILRQLTALGKISTAIDLIESTLEAGEKILVFSSFMEPLRQLQEKYADCSVMITGETPVQERGEIVTKFQEDPHTKIFFGGIRSAGVGITLTAASNVLFLDYAWNPADMQQAEDRIHRPGQEAASVNIYQLHAENTIDEKLLTLLKHKQVIFDKVIEGVAVSQEDKQASKQAFKDVVSDVLARNKKDPSEVSVEEFAALFA